MPRLIRCTEETVRGSIVLSDSESRTYGIGTSHIIACHGLKVQGLILPSSESTRRVLSRSAFYYYPELPKVFHFYIGIGEKISTKELFASIDEYLFEYNCRYPESKLHGKAIGNNSGSILYDRYLPADPEVWIHDPMWAMNDGHGPNGDHQITDEEMNSGTTLFDNPWQEYINKITPLIHCMVGVHDKLSPGIDHSKLIKFSPDDPQATEQIKGVLSFFEGIDPEKVTTFQPMIVNRKMYISYDELKELSINFPNILAYLLEKNPLILKEPEKDHSACCSNHEQSTDLDEAIRTHGLSKRRNNPEIIPDIEYVYTNHYHDQNLLAYFIDGLAASRPRSAFLSFYQILERLGHERKGKTDEKKALRDLICDKSLFSDLSISNSCKYADRFHNNYNFTQRFRGKSGRWKRCEIADMLYDETRNPLIHAKCKFIKGDDALNQKDSILPFSRLEYEHEIESRTILCRELARAAILRT